MKLFCTNALIREFCRERASFVENKRMPIIRSDGEILLNKMRILLSIY